MLATGNKAALDEVTLIAIFAKGVSKSAITKFTGVGVPFAHKI